MTTYIIKITHTYNEDSYEFIIRVKNPDHYMWHYIFQALIEAKVNAEICYEEAEKR